MKLNFEFEGDIQGVKQNREKGVETEKKLLIDWVLKECIGMYFEIKLQSRRQHLPSVTSNLTDMPFYSSGGFHSSTESTALKKVSAFEWLNTFHEHLDKLPQIHKEIIMNKYLKRDSGGRFPLDDFVYCELHITRKNYYVLKKEALYWLGLQLIKQEVMHSEGVM
ncbi:hypothetical protein H7992_04915 [Sporosarcina sp. resist]|uniref:ArpU family phage packaging/lysis transcriptional regulator n=1 Tax=Sporosarcina sp. resist TaxID=2762563 RepID=UPI00164DFA16|nr:ArpU family phage packaging/lysis transcriptional regulator [Sporosarcina sp. resist]QNK89069.1 hypothetical protein H7992_04915 [Sporosarcina sp. resist]